MRVRTFIWVTVLFLFVALDVNCTSVGFVNDIYVPNIFVPKWIGYLAFGFFSLPLLRAVYPKLYKG